MKYEWRESNKQPYLYVEATNQFELGVGLGQNLTKQITATQMVFEKMISNTKGTPAEKYLNREILSNMVGAYMQYVPEHDLEEIKGMHKGYVEATGESLTLDDFKFQSVMINVIYQFMSKMPPEMSLQGCTNFGVVNPDGTIVHGQNYDADGRMKAGNAFVHHKLKGEPEAFLYRTGADLGTATGKNEAGVCMTVSVLQSNQVAPIMKPRGVLVREAMRQNTARAAVDAMIDDKGQSPFSYNLVISDNTSIIATQAIPTEQRMTYVKNQIVQSNQYDYYDWIKYLKKPSYSKKRHLYSENLLNSIFSRYGKVTNEDLLEILRDKPIICRQAIDDGIGTTILFLTRESFGHGNASDSTIGKLPF
ncbi:hypothetical protein IMX26_17200 [Clostridium sp. 'deep sea']|uniref:C45 family autoproteolytic acyltransferase/hydolase n=1 Tax=Clostridium sp. 'deep sea' TaxID=2779445 RepID=UPI0018966B33|nr:C45 family autoproteolytic acyltransferase/hydolase [Clostridium sp. 'deep sea']QOR35171.1 hypothetical protein IMX26_17200 [Clostridium sp. 'deep sea']